MNTDTGFGEWVIRFRWWIIVSTILVVAAAASGGRFLQFSNNYRIIALLNFSPNISPPYPHLNNGLSHPVGRDTR